MTSDTLFLKNPFFRVRKAVACQKPLQGPDTAQRRRKGRFILGSQRRLGRICCKPRNHRKVDGVRLNLKERICPTRTMRYFTQPIHCYPILLWASSLCISSGHQHLTHPGSHHNPCKNTDNICIMQMCHMQISTSENNMQS